jgi:hypothetical protein
VALSTITLTSTCVYYLISEALQQGASQFEASAGKLKRKFWWKNCKVKYVCGFYLHFIILYGCPNNNISFEGLNTHYQTRCYTS